MPRFQRYLDELTFPSITYRLGYFLVVFQIPFSVGIKLVIQRFYLKICTHCTVQEFVKGSEELCVPVVK